MTDGSADTRYGYRAWDRRPGDGVDPSLMLDAAGVIAEVSALAPEPLSAGAPLRFLGFDRVQPTIDDVLRVGPVGQIEPQGMQGTLRNVQSAW